MASVVRKCCSYRTLKRRLPILAWLPQYTFQWLRMDLLAGVTVGLTVVPQALAYAEIAGLPVQYGLYSSFMGCFVYCFLGTSKDITLGPTAIMSLLVASYAYHDPVYAVLLAFLCGCIQLAMGILHLGFLVDFISYPVIKGFTSSAALTIGFGQVKNILGLCDIPRQFFREVYYTFHNIAETRIGDLVLGLVCLFLLVLLKMMKNQLPEQSGHQPFLNRVCSNIVRFTGTARNAVVVVAASLVAYSFESQDQHVFTLTGKTARGLPPFRLPSFSDSASNGTICFTEMLQNFGAGLAVVPLVGFLESIAIAKAFASQNNYRIDPNQELIAIGSANILGSFLSSYPVTGSFGRTAVNSQTGVRSPAGGIATGVVVLLSLAFLTPLFFYIPKAALAAVIICAVSAVFDLKIVVTLWRVNRLDLLPFLASFLGCFWEIQYGILAGIALSGTILFFNIARPEIKISDYGTVIVQLQSGLNFPAVEYVCDKLYQRVLEASPPSSVILDCLHVSSIDYTTVNGLRELIQTFQQKKVCLLFSNFQPKVLSILTLAEIEGLRHFDSTEAALRHLHGDDYTHNLEESEKPLLDRHEGFYS
ncbi:sodium-independent sulfate anion transporter [Scyliorhinus canicula]|uniref:sodium-independent sulfate anion transporter n=1 Tax=Scyliorhinus canicula TaxID=7830 RepID=UPI0018F3E987|nr:sodium-independent sulfate anion transporter [Scyliorhinus canicula]XP_038632944.1 sodium-independent sulfate anion transporter [Scyliorhinus canicula]XP_038632945.1 sodium-independent sulfate anion transporter [Scyliorhinus canicula]